MNKDYNMKDNPQDDYGNLRKRINQGIKGVRDDGDESKQSQAKTIPMIPVTGRPGSGDKHLNNKSIHKF